MTEIFLHIVNMSITATILAVVVLLLRLLLKKAPKWISVLLWGLVALRLICPFAVASPFSLMPKTDWVVQEPLTEEDFFLDSVPDRISAFDSSSLGSDITVQYSYYPLENSNIEIHRGISISFILSCIWAAGMAALFLHTVISTIRLHRSIGAAVRVRDNVWESSAVESPFVLGLFRPRIYVPRGMSEEKLAYVIAHEEAHIRRRDHWWKPLGFLLLTIHWFNPVLWLAYILLCRDIEMACDERVIKEYDDVQRADYSEALLDCSVKRQMITACPLAFGEVSVKERIKSVLNYKKPAFWIVVLAVIACVVTAACFLTNPQQNLSIESVSRVIYNEMDVSDIYAQELVTLINDSRRTYFSVGADDPNDLSVSIQIDCEDGSMYLLHYQYYSGFSFSPTHPGEDDYRSILTYFSPDGKGSRAWRLEYDFDAKFKKWLAAVRADPGIPYIPETDTQSGKQLTLEDVITLSAKGYDLRWSDFEQFQYTETGSGLYIRVYEIDGMFELWIGGGDTESEPMYIRLKIAGDTDAPAVDIRDGEVEDFIEQCRSNGLLTDEISEYTMTYYRDIAWDEAQTLAESEGIAIDKNWFNLRHTYNRSTIWVQFYGITKTGWDDRYVDITIVRDDEGNYKVDPAGCIIGVNSENIKNTTKIVIENCVENIESVLDAGGANFDIRETNSYACIMNYNSEWILDYVFSEFLKGGQTDHRGFVLWQVMTDLLNENEKIAYDAENGQDYFDHWLESARSVGKQHDTAWLRENVPAIALLLKMVDE